MCLNSERHLLIKKKNSVGQPHQDSKYTASMIINRWSEIHEKKFKLTLDWLRPNLNKSPPQVTPKSCGDNTPTLYGGGGRGGGLTPNVQVWVTMVSLFFFGSTVFSNPASTWSVPMRS